MITILMYNVFTSYSRVLKNTMVHLKSHCNTIQYFFVSVSFVFLTLAMPFLYLMNKNRYLHVLARNQLDSSDENVIKTVKYKFKFILPAVSLHSHLNMHIYN